MHFFIAWVVILSMAAPVAADDVLTSPYRDQRSTEIRGLTEKEILELREGRGMGLARTAELNGYPGPRHVLDAVREGRLHLRPDQVQTMQRLFDDMSQEAQRLGLMILKEEWALERGEDPRRHIGGADALAAVLKEDRELVAAKPRGRVGRPERVLDALADLAE